jgi:hypothetical protein
MSMPGAAYSLLREYQTLLAASYDRRETRLGQLGDFPAIPAETAPHLGRYSFDHSLYVIGPKINKTSCVYLLGGAASSIRIG